MFELVLEEKNISNWIYRGRILWQARVIYLPSNYRLSWSGPSGVVASDATGSALMYYDKLKWFALRVSLDESVCLATGIVDALACVLCQLSWKFLYV